jgi:putative hydrolase of the HAD superfamily
MRTIKSRPSPLSYKRDLLPSVKINQSRYYFLGVQLIKVISFDLDGTLVSQAFANHIWFEGIPRLYAKKHGVSLASAKTIVTSEYEKMGPERLEWYDIKYWLKHFSLGRGWRKLFEQYEDKLSTFEEVQEALQDIQRDYKLAVASTAAREFLKFALTRTGLKRYFNYSFSSVSDFGKPQKDEQFYRKMLRTLKSQARQVLHIGDDIIFDFFVPRNLGMRAFLLDRDRIKHGKYVIHDLTSLRDKIKKLRKNS